MNRRIPTCVFLAVFIWFFVGFDAGFPRNDEPIKCSACHTHLSRLLPASHRSYNIATISSCLSCHGPGGNGKPLGEGIHMAHLQKSSDTMKNCLSCHVADKLGEVTFPGYPGMKADKNGLATIFPFFESWMRSPYLDHDHMMNGIYCLGCHRNYVDQVEASETQERCIECHGDYERLMKLPTSSNYDNNPHKTHYPDLKCRVCHHGHKEFTDYCAQCHQFDYKSPSLNKKKK